MDYEDFKLAKVAVATENGIAIAAGDVNPALKPFNRDMVKWALAGGRRAIFASFGLHKTCCQLELMRLVGPNELRLIVIPLGVRQEFIEDATRFFGGQGYSFEVKFIQSDEEVTEPGVVYLTNYESIREGKIDPSRFTAVSLDEGSCLRSFGSKTFSEMLFGKMQQVKYRWVCTATPSPNDYLELIAYAHFLGIMDMGEAKTRFFKRNSEQADELTLHPHKAQEFWLWVASWALFIQRPSDLGYSDEGYELPELEVHWHEVPSDAPPIEPNEKRKQGAFFEEPVINATDLARIKKQTLPARIAKWKDLRESRPGVHCLTWHDLEDERKAIEAAGVPCVFGSQKPAEQERFYLDFRNGVMPELGAKPMQFGSGCNFQKHCSWAVFLGISYKFNDFIQAIHRVHRFGQTGSVRVDIIYSESERKVREQLEAKWQRDKHQRTVMSEIIREYGLSHSAIEGALTRSNTTERRTAAGSSWEVVNEDSVLYYPEVESDSRHMVLTSIPFSTQYEYTPHLADFGHTDDDDHFFAQMDFLTPELLRILQPGRIAAIHVKDRVVPGEIIGQSYQTVSPFTARTLMHFMKHGFTYMGMITIVTDVVRENAQTYRLSWSMQCEDGSRMGVGMPEYVLLFRKPPSDPSRGFADIPVAKTKEEYTRGRWQLDAHGYWRSSGNRLLEPEDFALLNRQQIFRKFREISQTGEYDHDRAVALAEFLDRQGVLPPDFMLLQPWSDHPDVWSDVTRMLSLNSRQTQRRREKHLCPLPFDVVDRLINRFTNPGEIVEDPFGGVGTTPLRAVKLGRQGRACELNPNYWDDQVFYLREADRGADQLSLIEALGPDLEDAA